MSSVSNFTMFKFYRNWLDVVTYFRPRILRVFPVRYSGECLWTPSSKQIDLEGASRLPDNKRRCRQQIDEFVGLNDDLDRLIYMIIHYYRPFVCSRFYYRRQWINRSICGTLDEELWCCSIWSVNMVGFTKTGNRGSTELNNFNAKKPHFEILNIFSFWFIKL